MSRCHEKWIELTAMPWPGRWRRAVTNVRPAQQSPFTSAQPTAASDWSGDPMTSRFHPQSKHALLAASAFTALALAPVVRLPTRLP